MSGKIKSSESASTHASAIKDACNGIESISITEDQTSQYQGNDALKENQKNIQENLKRAQDATEKYAQAIVKAKDAYKKADEESAKK